MACSKLFSGIDVIARKSAHLKAEP